MNDTKYSGLLDRFTGELRDWNLNGKEPFSASVDVRYDLDEREKRLKEKGLQAYEEFEHVGDEIHGALRKEGNPFFQTTLYRESNHTVQYRRDGKIIYSSKKPENLYVSVMDRHSGHTEDFPYNCPNCGNVVMASALQQGCPYCGTRFEVSDLYPKVNGYYTVPAIVERATLMDKIKRRCLIAGIVGGIIGFVMAMIGYDDIPVPWRILAGLFFGGFIGGMSAFMMYLANSFVLLGKVFYEAGRAVPMLGGLGTGKRMTKQMKAYDPDFSFELFEGKVLSRLRAIAFSKDRDHLTVWSGSDDLSFFDNLVDMRYRGALVLKKLSEKDGKITAVVKAFVTDLYCTKRVQEKDETVFVTMEIGKDALSDQGFSVHTVTCKSCGASFDAMHRRTCPHCGNEYKLVREDWVVTSIRK